MNMRRQYFVGIIPIVAVSVVSITAAPCLAQAPVVIDRVLAVEEAGSPLGQYRIVFTTQQDVPGPTDYSPGIGFALGDETLRFSPMAPRSLTHHGYVDRLPAGMSQLRVVDPSGAASPAVRLDARSLLAASRPSRGQYEARHIRRSPGDVDLWQAWSDAEVVFIGVLLREDNDPANDAIWRLYLQPQQVLRGGEGLALPDLVILHVDGRLPWNELGGRYLVFAHVKGGVLDAAPGAHAEVRLWWPRDDDVLDLVTRRAAMGDQPAPAEAGALLLDRLLSPVLEVRYTAAVQLERLAGQLPGDLLERLHQAARAAVQSEPSPIVRRALGPLLAP